jgi:hypothetical protein
MWASPKSPGPVPGLPSARVVLIFDLWNPLLAPAERELVRTLAGTARAFASTESAT